MKLTTTTLCLLLIAGCASHSQKAPVGDLQMFGTAPKPLHMVDPKYPPQMARLGIGDIVKWKVHVGADGTVKSASALASNRFEFREPALDAVRQWTFEPARTPSGPADALVGIPIAFEVPGADS